MPDLNKELESTENRISNISQLTEQEIQSIMAVQELKVKNQEDLYRIASEQVRKLTNEGKIAIKDEATARNIIFDAYIAHEKQERQKAYENQVKNVRTLSYEEKKDFKANAAYRLKEDFHANRELLQQKLASNKDDAKARREIEKEMFDLAAKYEDDLLALKKKNAEEEKNAAPGIAGKLGATLEGPLNKLSTNLAKNLSKEADKQAKVAKAEADKYEAAKQAAEDAKAQFGEDSQEYKEARAKQEEQFRAATAAENKANFTKMASAIVKGIGEEYKRQYDTATSILTDYMGAIDARVQGSDTSFKELNNKISNNLSLSPFVKTTKVLEEVKKAVENGIAYNIEQRAFLSSLSDKIATTFDVFDSNLMRVIRLQQADTTAARMGMEASLTKLFNNMFQDTSYLGTMADQVSQAIVDATSMLDYKSSAEFEYVVQKWLGALGSLGISEGAVSQIAQGINYLATGDVQNLANNPALQTMFAMAASNAGEEYSDILLNGLDASRTNKLLEHVIRYLKTITEESENQVVRQAYGDIFSLTASDMKAISNLTAQEISYLSGTNLSYSKMSSEINNQMLMVATRTSLAAMLDNVYQNVLYGVAADMASNPVTFAMQKMLDFLEDTETDIAIPFVNAMGFGLDVNATVKDLMQMGLGIGQGMSLAMNIGSALMSGSAGGLNLDSWGASETTKRGTGVLTLSTGGTLGAVSGSQGGFIGGGNAEDMKKDSISGAAADAEETSALMGQEEKEHDFDEFYNAVVGPNANDYVRVMFGAGGPMRVDIASIEESAKYDIISAMSGIKGAVEGVIGAINSKQFSITNVSALTQETASAVFGGTSSPDVNDGALLVSIKNAEASNAPIFKLSGEDEGVKAIIDALKSIEISKVLEVVKVTGVDTVTNIDGTVNVKGTVEMSGQAEVSQPPSGWQ